MNAHEKLERIEELLEERARINADLIALLEPEASEAEHDEPAPTPGKRKPRKCGQCGKPGHIARHCTGIGARAAAPIEVSGQPLAEDEFDEMKHLQKIGDLSSRDFAEDRGVSLAEVNRAIGCRNFEEYSK
jgi:hypothetical protein